MLNDTWEADYNEFVSGNKLALCSGLSYRGRVNRLENAQKMHALIIDLDSVTINELKTLLLRMGKEPGYRTIPQATFLVLSGTGVHLYYLLDKPIDLFPNIKLQMKALKYDLTFKIWEYKATSLEEQIQYQSISQGFRMVGSINDKYNLPIKAFKIGDTVSIDYLNSYAIEEDNKVNLEYKFKPSKYTIDEAKEKFPDWYERVIIEGNKTPNKWHIKKDLYYWWLRQMDKVKGGHRYYFLMCIAIYGVKCDVPKFEVEKDMRKIFKDISKIEHSNKLTEEDLKSALEAYDRAYFNFTIDDIVKLTDIQIVKNKRNYQSQKHHLEEARMIRDLRMKRQGKKWTDNNGRPKGSGTKEKLILNYIENNPLATPTEISRDLKISRTTVYKYLKQKN